MKKSIAIIILLILLILSIFLKEQQITALKSERDSYKQTTETLFKKAMQYLTKDSLNAIQVGVLELKVKEYERYRAEDAALIKSLQTKNRELQNSTTVKTETITKIQTVIHDSIVINYELPITNYDTLHCLSVKDEWFKFEGCIDKEGIFDGYIINNESLLIAVTLKHKRFLGFLWKTKKIKDKQVDAVSKNPNTKILEVEYIEIKN
jgi:hypothetical protein